MSGPLRGVPPLPLELLPDTAVVGPDGRLSTIYYGESWEAEHILRDIEKARKG